jgi:probable HAF family extracellular repeat protein
VPTASIGTWSVALVDAGEAGPNALNRAGVLAYTRIDRLLGPRARIFDTSLHELPRIPAFASAVNGTGEVAGALAQPDGTTVAMRWAALTDDPPTPIDLAPGSSSVANAINAAGVIAATITRQGVATAARWVGTVVQGLASVGQATSSALFINTRGDIAGVSTLAGSSAHATLWRPDNSVVDIGTLGDGESAPTALNDAGQVAGESLTAEGRQHAFLWSEAAGLRDLGTLGGPTSTASGLNASGWVVGTADTPDDTTIAFLWRDNAMRPLGTLGGRSSAASAINASGLVGGNSETATGVQHAFVWTEAAGMVDLNNLVSGGEPLPGVLQTVMAVADDGTVLATAEGGLLVLLRPAGRA